MVDSKMSIYNRRESIWAVDTVKHLLGDSGRNGTDHTIIFTEVDPVLSKLQRRHLIIDFMNTCKAMIETQLPAHGCHEINRR